MLCLSGSKNPATCNQSWIISRFSKSFYLQIYANLTPAVTHSLSETANHWQVKVCEKRGLSVVSLDWLMEVASSGKYFTPRPSQYIFLGNATRAGDAGLDSFGDRQVSGSHHTVCLLYCQIIYVNFYLIAFVMVFWLISIIARREYSGWK